jgi:DNA-binding response OmpR family regulator
VGGIELCRKIKDTPSVAHIPVMLLTASSSDEIKLKGIEGGAEDYITKPFDMEIIQAKVRNILKSRNRLQQYFFNAVTLKPDANMAGEHKEFVERCIAIVEKHLDNPDFNIQTFSREIGMSHPSLYKKVKAISGLTINVFIRYLRLRKAAELLINTDKTIVEVTYITGFNDIKYFREQFYKLFNMNPSEYIKKYRKILGSKPADN